MKRTLIAFIINFRLFYNAQHLLLLNILKVFAGIKFVIDFSLNLNLSLRFALVDSSFSFSI